MRAEPVHFCGWGRAGGEPWYLGGNQTPALSKKEPTPAAGPARVRVQLWVTSLLRARARLALPLGAAGRGR